MSRSLSEIVPSPFLPAVRRSSSNPIHVSFLQNFHIPKDRASLIIKCANYDKEALVLSVEILMEGPSRCLTGPREGNYLSKQKDEIAFLTKKRIFYQEQIRGRFPTCETDTRVPYEPNTITSIKNKICCPYKSLQRGKEISFQYELSF